MGILWLGGIGLDKAVLGNCSLPALGLPPLHPCPSRTQTKAFPEMNLEFGDTGMSRSPEGDDGPSALLAVLSVLSRVALAPEGTDIPVSLPVQCTEDVGTGDGQRSPESRQNHPGAPTSSTPHLEGSACPMGQPRATKRLPPSPGHGAGAAAEGEKGEAPARRRTWILPVPWEGGTAPCSPGELETLNPGAGDAFPNLLDLYEAPEALEREEAPGDVALVEIRGPVKTCWSPGWVLEEGTLGAGLSAEAAPACELCQEILPSEAAGHAEYLNHLLLHLE
ncbi:uncharacterized protein LOC119712677 isoform X1 [Motacilla alba alba]|uniref:uncharacterized protein LOC119712677 isoform X1 n=1 Tax=Motacilla alba alba TaxID=1094192 RepID=UPI0018D53462|nr:uncharacterized protein LOC119712677 isoform X1 [Motacilla alba alba]